MITTEFEYIAPSSVEEAISLLGRYGEDAKILAGGHSLIPIMKLRLARPRYLIDIGHLDGLAYIREQDGAVAIGAMTTHHMVESSDLLHSKLPILVETAAQIADVQVRNRGTIGGSLAHADPAADLPATALALDAEVRVKGTQGARSINAGEFFTGMLTTALRADEVVTAVRFPLPPARSGGAYAKAPNKASHYAIVGVAATVTIGGDGRCSQVRIGVTGTAHTPFRAREAEGTLTGKEPDQAAIGEAADAVTSGVEALSDVHASAEFRLHLTRVHTKRALQSAVSRAQAA